MGYHNSKILKGKLGEYSKIKEEFDELSDAHHQHCYVLEIVELCDLIGAIEAYATKWNLSLSDLIQMKERTKSAFEDGTRSSTSKK